MTGENDNGSKADPKKVMRRIERDNVVIIVLMGLGSLYFKSAHLSLSFLGGAGLMAVNLHLLTRIAGHIVRTGAGGATKSRIFAEVMVSGLFLFGGFTVILLLFDAAPFAFIIGTATLIPTLVYQGLKSILLSRNNARNIN